MVYDGAARQCSDCGWVIPAQQLPPGVSLDQAIVEHSDYCAAPGFP